MDRDRRNQVILAVLMTVVTVVVIYSTLVTWLQNQIRQETRRMNDSEAELQQLNTALRNAREAAEEAERERGLLERWEARLPQGSAYTWLLRELEPMARTNSLTEFALSSVQASALNLTPALGYMGVKGTLVGVGAYQQIGLFVADFENAFPFTEVEALNLDVAGSGIGIMTSDRDYPVLGMKLEFRGCGRGLVF